MALLPDLTPPAVDASQFVGAQPQAGSVDVELLKKLLQAYNPTQMQSAAAAQPAPTSVQPVQVAQPTEPTTQPSQLGEFLKGPALAVALGRLAAAVNPQGSWAQQLGAQAAQLGTNQQYAAALRKMLAGGDLGFEQSPIANNLPTPVEAIGLSPKEQSSIYQASLAKRSQATAEENAKTNRMIGQARVFDSQIDALKALASLAPKHNEYEARMANLGDRIALMSYDKKAGDWKLNGYLKVGATPSSKSAVVPASTYSNISKQLTGAFMPALEQVMKHLYPKQQEFASQMSAMKGTLTGLDPLAVTAKLKEISPGFAEVWDDYFNKLESAVLSGKPLSSVPLPIIKDATKASEDDKDKPVLYFGHSKDKEGKQYYTIYYKPAGEDINNGRYIYTDLIKEEK